MIVAQVDQLYDVYDAEHLQQLFLENLPAVYGFETAFDCPVKLTLYYDQATRIDRETLKKVIEKREIRLESGATIRKVRLNYRLSGVSFPDTSITRSDFVNTLFVPFRQTFGRFDQTPMNLIDTLRLRYDHPGESRYQRLLPYLTSHLSVYPAVLGIRTTIGRATPELQIFYHKEKATAAEINRWANAHRLQIHYANGKTGSLANPFRTEPE
jgi:hypothetical protein